MSFCQEVTKKQAVNKALFMKISTLLLFFSLPLLTSAAEMENPYYRQWAFSKVGSSVTYVGKAEGSSGITSFTQTITLEEIANDHMVLEIARQEEGVAPVIKKKNVNRSLGKSEKGEYRGQEEIMIAGKRFTCHLYTLKALYDSEQEITFDYWFNTDIPGFAKCVAKSLVSGKIKDMVTQTAVNWEKK